MPPPSHGIDVIHSDPDDDVELARWIDSLTETEMKAVLRYMLLLNADAVQSAMRYVQRRNDHRPSSEKNDAADDDDEPPPPLLIRRKSQDDDDDDYCGNDGDDATGSIMPVQDRSNSKSQRSNTTSTTVRTMTTTATASTSPSSSSIPSPIHSRPRGGRNGRPDHANDDGDTTNNISHPLASPSQPKRTMTFPPPSPSDTTTLNQSMMSSSPQQQNQSQSPSSRTIIPGTNATTTTMTATARTNIGNSSDGNDKIDKATNDFNRSTTTIINSKAKATGMVSFLSNMAPPVVGQTPNNVQPSDGNGHGGSGGGSTSSHSRRNNHQNHNHNHNHHQHGTKPKKTLVVLCSMKPSSQLQATQQDKSMALCKEQGILPYIVLAETKVDQTLELMQVSGPQYVHTFPQFFLQYKQQVEFLGDYDAIEELYYAGEFTPQFLLKVIIPPPKSKSIIDMEQARVDRMFQQTSELRLKLLHDGRGGGSTSTTMTTPAADVGSAAAVPVVGERPPDTNGSSPSSGGTTTTTTTSSSGSHASMDIHSSSDDSHSSSRRRQQRRPQQLFPREDEHELHQQPHQQQHTTQPMIQPMRGVRPSTERSSPPQQQQQQHQYPKSPSKSLHEHLERDTARTNQMRMMMTTSDDDDYTDGDDGNGGGGAGGTTATGGTSNATTTTATTTSGGGGNGAGDGTIAPLRASFSRGGGASIRSMDEISLGDDLNLIFDPKPPARHKTKQATIMEERNRARAAGTAGGSDTVTTAATTTTVAPPIQEPAIQEEDEDESESSGGEQLQPSSHPLPVDKSRPEAAPNSSAAAMAVASSPSTGNDNPMEQLQSTIRSTSNSNVTVTESPSGTWRLRETVTLKPAGSRRPGPATDPTTTVSKVHLKPANERVVINSIGADLTNANGTVTIPGESTTIQPKAQQQVQLKSLSLKKLTIVNPYYALDTYAPSQAVTDDASQPQPQAETVVLTSPTPAVAVEQVVPTTTEPPAVHNREPTSTAVPSSSPSQPAWMQVYQQQEEEQQQGVTAAVTASAAPSSGRDAPSQRGVDRHKSWEKRFLGVGACYLVYDAVEGELNIHYSEIPIIGAVGVWTTPDIALFKEAQGLSQSELIGNCASQVMTQDRLQYYNGWCQFVKAAKSMDATVTVLDGMGVPIDFYLYRNGTTARMENNTFDTDAVDAVACVPKNCDFSSVSGLRGKKWTKAAKKLGAVALFKTLSSKDGEGPPQDGGYANDDGANNPPGGGGGEQFISIQNASVPLMGMPIPEEEPITEAIQDPHTRQQQQPPVMSSLPQREPIPYDAPVPAQAPQQPIANESISVVPAEPHEHQPEPVPVPTPQAASLSVETTPSALTPDSNGSGYSSAWDAPSPTGGACYLLYEPDSSGRLVEHFSYTPVEGAIGRWVPGPTKKIAGFKFKRNLGRNVLIGNCSAGVQGRKNYCSGWCQFVRSAKGLDGEVMLWDPTAGAKGMMVDVYLYFQDTRPAHQTVRLVQGKAQSTDNLLAVSCIPKNTPFYEGMAVDILKWLADGGNYGYSSKI